PQAPGEVLGFAGSALSTTQVRWMWDASPGATAYHLLNAGAGAVASLAGSATQYIDVLTPNATSQIVAIRALNDVGAGPVSQAPEAPIAALAAAPGTPTFGSVAQSSVAVSWAPNGNPAGTPYEVYRATAVGGPFALAYSAVATTIADIGLAPAATYYYRVRAKNFNGFFSGYSATASVVTLPATIPSIIGRVAYAGRQQGSIWVQAYASSGPYSGHASSVPFSGLAASVRLTLSADQPYYLEVPGGQSYFVRAFVDVDASSGATNGEARGHFQISTGPALAIAVGGGPVSGKNFAVFVDTTPPASPLGTNAQLSYGRVDLKWTSPVTNENGTTLYDLAGFRVQRTTVPAAGFTTLSTYTVRGVTGTVSGTTFADRNPVGGVDNIYRIIAVDYGGNESRPSGALAVKPSVGGTISGSISTFTATTSGAYRVRLSTSPRREDPFKAETTLTSFSFAGLEDGTYFLRAFRDLDGDSLQDDNEPAGTHGGIAQPFPLKIVGGNTVSSRIVTICDRTTINLNSGASASLQATDCTARDRGAGHYTDLYTFRVGGGAQGSVAPGSQIHASMFSPEVSPWLFLIGPDGNVVDDDNYSGGAFIEFMVNQEGLYILEPTTVDPGQTGFYDISLNVVGGYNGTISGVTSYSGSKTGPVQIQVFDNPDTTNAFPFLVQTEPSAGAFSIGGMPDGRFYFRSFMDVNGNGIKDASEPSGAYGLSASSLSAVNMYGGVPDTSSVEIRLTDPAVGTVKGQILREGSQAGTIRVEIGKRQCSDCEDIDVVRFATIPAAGPYILEFVPPATTYVLRGYVDANGNNMFDMISEASKSSAPVTVQSNSTTTVNLLVIDNGIGAAGNSVISGTITYSGSSTGTVFMGFATDRGFEYLPYTLTLASTGSYIKSGVLGNTSYYIGAFIDVNGNGNMDDEGDVIEPGAPYSATGGEPTPVYVPQSSSVVVSFAIPEPPGGVISGTVTYSSSTARKSGDIVVQAYTETPMHQEGGWRNVRIPQRVGVSSYSYRLPGLVASTFRVNAFVDGNFNERSDFGEPFFERQQSVAVSSGPGASPVAGINLFIADAGQGGPTGNIGKLSGWVDYFGGQPGPMVVQAFTTNTFVGRPLLHGTAGGGPSNFSFDFGNVPFNTYFLRAFKDANNDGLLAPAFEASGRLTSPMAAGSTITLKNDFPVVHDLYGLVEDPGKPVGAGSDSLSGTVLYKTTAPVSGKVHVLIFKPGSDSPVRSSTYAVTTSPISYSFGNLEPGQYFPRAFIDVNGDFSPNAGEPFGGFRYEGVFVQGSVGGADFDVCERFPINTTPGVPTTAFLATTDCRSLDAPLGASGLAKAPYQKMFRFAGSRGQVVTISMEGVGFFDTYLTLYGPRGGLLIQDDDGAGKGNARISEFVVPESGQYMIGASAFAGGITGEFKVTFAGSAGSLGSIAGEVTYSGSQGGQVRIGLFNSPNFGQPTASVDGRNLPGPGPFSFGNLASGTSYYLGAFIDVNGNLEIDEGEDSGAFGGFESPDPVYLRSGQNVDGIILDIVASTEAAAGASGITGFIAYAGPQRGILRVQLFADPSFAGKPVAERAIPTGFGPYDLGVPGGQPYFVRAFLDVNNNFALDSFEPSGVYAPNNQGAEPVFPPLAGAIHGVDFDIFDPGFDPGVGGAAGEGTGSVTPATASAGELLASVTVQLLVGENGIQPGGEIVMGVPPGFPFPQGSGGQPGYVTVASSNTMGQPASLSLEFPAGFPAAIARVVNSTPLYTGATVQFNYHDAYLPCFAQEGTFFLATKSTGTVPKPEPLFNGSPRVAIVAGSAELVQVRGGYFSLLQNTTSEALVLEGFDRCGNIAAVATSTSVVLRAKRYSFSTGLFADEGGLKFSSRTTGQFASQLALTFAQNNSSRTFVAVSTAIGDLAIEIYSELDGPATFYAGVNVVGTDILTNVSVSTVPFRLGRTSATITPNGDGVSDQAFVNFDLNDPNLGWQAMVSSVPYKSGAVPNPVWQAWGFGPPGRGQISWDGRYSPWINGGARVPTGSYYVRVDIGGIRNDTLRIDVEAPQLAGQVLDAGVTPNKPLPSVKIDLYGPFGGGFTETNSAGGFVMAGLAAASYQMNFSKPGYQIGRASVTINSSGKVTGFKAAGSQISLSSTSAGALIVRMNRAPSLRIIPRLEAGATQAFELWGGLQVHNGSFAQPQSVTFVINGPLRLRPGTTTFDDGGQWDPSLQRFVEKTQFRYDVPPGTYTVRASLPGFEEVTSSGVYVASGELQVTLPEFARRKVISGAVTLPAGYNTNGIFVSVSAVPLSTAAQAQEGFTGVFLPPGASSDTYRLEGLKGSASAPVSYSLSANARGLAPVRIASVTLAGVDISTDLPAFADP
ncbi:MAG: hypothetical protein ABII00_05475, partial [Elusimicrobiota bacterium]